MANDKDKIYEKIYSLWKGEGEKRNQSIDWYCERYHVDVEDWRKWYRGISKAVKVVKVVGGPTEDVQVFPEEKPLVTEAELEQEPRIVISTTDMKKKVKSAIGSVTITCGNGLHLTRNSMSHEEFLAFAQNLKALC